jgi:ABC-type multidrug transport system ATPase subunit
MSGGRLLVVDTPEGLRHHAYGGDIVEFESVQPLSFEDEHLLRILPFVQSNTMRTGPNSLHIIVNDASTSTPEIMKFMQERNVEVKSIEVSTPPFEDVFVELVRHQPGESNE